MSAVEVRQADKIMATADREITRENVGEAGQFVTAHQQVFVESNVCSITDANVGSAFQPSTNKPKVAEANRAPFRNSRCIALPRDESEGSR